MPTFKVRLNDPDSDEFRIVVIPADSEEAAVSELLRRERKKVDYRLTTDEMAEAKSGKPNPATAKARLVTHEQSKPYEVVSVENYEGGFWKAAKEARAARKKD